MSASSRGVGTFRVVVSQAPPCVQCPPVHSAGLRGLFGSELGRVQMGGGDSDQLYSPKAGAAHKTQHVQRGIA